MTDWEQRALASEAALERMIYSISHDLNEPVRKLSAFTRLLTRSLEDLTEEQARWVDFINDAGSRLTEMIEAILIISRVGRMDTTERTQDTRAMVQVAWRDLETDRELVVEDLPNVTADSDHFLKLWRHALSNAVIHGKGRVTVRASGDPVRFEISDEGTGVDPAYESRAFDLFQRLQPRNTESPGIGAGLSVMRAIVEHKGGTIGFDAANRATLVFTWPPTTESNAEG